jgi:hypothetical protein
MDRSIYFWIDEYGLFVVDWNKMAYIQTSCYQKGPNIQAGQAYKSLLGSDP